MQTLADGRILHCHSQQVVKFLHKYFITGPSPLAYSMPALMLSTVHRWQWSFTIAKVPNATLASEPCSPGPWERISAELQGSVSDFFTPPPQCWSPRAVFTQGRNLTPYRSYIVFTLKSKCQFATEKVFFPCGLNQVSFLLLSLK